MPARVHTSLAWSAAAAANAVVVPPRDPVVGPPRDPQPDPAVGPVRIPGWDAVM